jgi:glycosyltransferase involved in cell wall biosynthesis
VQEQAMKIAIIGARGIPACYSGIETSVEQLAFRLAPKGYSIFVYCRKSKNDVSGIHPNIRLIYLPTINTKHLSTLCHVFLSTLHALFSGADVFHFHALGPSLFAFLPRVLGRKTIVTVHALDWKREKWGVFARFALKCCEYAAVFSPHKTVVVSRSMQAYFEKKFHKKVIYIPNAVTMPELLDQKYSPDAGLKSVLFTGRLTPEKGLHRLIKAFNSLTENAILLIAGSSSFSDTYARYLKSIAGKSVRFLGFIQGDALRDLYRSAYVFVLPSEIEGLSFSLLEAMSYGKCVLVSDLPESLEVIGDAGFSFITKNQNDLNKKLRYILDHPQEVLVKGLKARERVRAHYCWDNISSEAENLYHFKQGR